MSVSLNFGWAADLSVEIRSADSERLSIVAEKKRRRKKSTRLMRKNTKTYKNSSSKNSKFLNLLRESFGAKQK